MSSFVLFSILRNLFYLIFVGAVFLSPGTKKDAILFLL